MGLLKFFKKKKNANIKWDEAEYIIVHKDDFDKIEVLNDLYTILDLGLLEAKKLLAANEKIQLPIYDANLFLKLEDALEKHGAELQIYLKGKQLGNDKIQKPESSQDNQETNIEKSDESISSVNEDENDYYPDEENEPLIDYATGEIIEPVSKQ